MLKLHITLLELVTQYQCDTSCRKKIELYNIIKLNLRRGHRFPLELFQASEKISFKVESNIS